MNLPESIVEDTIRRAREGDRHRQRFARDLAVSRIAPLVVGIIDGANEPAARRGLSK